ncbi:hypothetical protein AYI70_g7275, partial [Smittium culicis]
QVKSGYRFPGSRLEAMGQRLLLPPLESDPPSTPTSTTGETNNDVSNSSLGVSHLVPNINQDDDNETMEDRSGGDYSGPKKRKISPLMQQEVVPLSMEDYQQFLQDQQFLPETIRLLNSNKRLIRRKTRNKSIQDKFLNWVAETRHTTEYNEYDLVNYLAVSFIEGRIGFNSLKTYKSSIIQMFIEDGKKINNNTLNLFIRNLEENAIITSRDINIDITPILNKFKSDGPSNELDIIDLTNKTLWLIAVCGFLRASDIHLIDDNRTIILENEVSFIIVGPKEKRKNRPIERLSVKDMKQIPKARAIGASLASQAGVPSDAIISQANWANYDTFDNYYRLTRDSTVNITNSIL